MQIRAIAYLLFFQSLISCLQNPEKVLPLAEASLGVQSAAGAQPGSANTLPSSASVAFRSLDGGQTWQGVSAGLPEGVETQGVFVVDGEVFLGSRDGLYRSSATTATPVWEQTPFLNGRITGVFPGRAGLYACSYEVGLFQNIPGTDVWQSRSKGLKDKSVRTVLESPAGDLFVGCDKGIFKSADGGQTWKPVYAGGM
jgi:photosystem II stability/assembly factor-like uncharacterized protein